MKNGLALFVCLLGGALVARSQTRPSPAPAPDTPPGRAAYHEIRSQWLRFIQANGKDADARAWLLQRGEPALEVMLDLLLGPPPPTIEPEALARLVSQLGAAEFQTREAAQRELESMGPGLAPLLQEYVQHGDPEIALRVSDLLRLAEQGKLPPVLQSPALTACTEILEVSWPMQEIRAVVKRNLDRLARVKTVEHHWDARPLGPLLGSLRHSEDAADRALLADFAAGAEDGAAEVALDLMANGLTGRTRPGMAAHWKTMPPHAYAGVLGPLLDPARPKVFKKAIYAAPRDEALRARLRDLLPTITDAAVREEVYTFLWHFMGDPAARDHYFEALESEDDHVFSTAVYRLTDCQFQYRGEEIIPRLRPTLRGPDAKRRLLILRQLDNYLGKASVALAAGEAAPFLASGVEEERTAAREVLLDLQGSGWGDILGPIAERHENAEVRAATTILYREWQESKK